MQSIFGLREWLDCKKSNKKLLVFAVIFLILGITSICIAGQKLEIINKVLKFQFGLLWVVGWSSAGISAGLFNRRVTKEQHKNDREDQCCHYIFYYGFALFVSSLAGFALGRHENGALNLPLSALISLTVGFASKRLNELIFKG